MSMQTIPKFIKGHFKVFEDALFFITLSIKLENCKSQYNNVGLGQNNIVVFPTFLFCPNRFQ